MISHIRYIFTIDHTDLSSTTIPISNFSARLREGDADSYLQVTIPALPTYQTLLLTYLDHCRTPYMTLYKRIYTTRTAYYSYPLTTVGVEDISLESGSTSGSIILDGHRATWNILPQTRALTGIDYVKYGYSSAYESTTTIRCSPANIVYPSDTVSYTQNGTTSSFLATSVSISADSVEVSNG